MNNKFIYYSDLNDKIPNEIMRKNINLFAKKLKKSPIQILRFADTKYKKFDIVVTPTYYIKIEGESYLYENFSNIKLLNHFKNPYIISEKANLTKVIEKNNFLSDIYPRTYIFKLNDTLKKEIDEFLRSFAPGDKKSLKSFSKEKLPGDKDNKAVMIVKPSNLRQGRDIQIFDNPEAIYNYMIENKSETYVIQKYISNPLLYEKRKFDIRIHVLLKKKTYKFSSGSSSGIKSYKTYFNDYGVIRTTSTEYTNKLTGDWNKDKFVHITNHAIQKYNENYEKYEKGNCIIWNTLNPENKVIRNDMIKIVKTLLNSCDLTPQKFDCYELLGFDFMIDENYKVWLLEVNINPGLSWNNIEVENLMDKMIYDTFDIVKLSDIDDKSVAPTSEACLVAKDSTWRKI